MKLMIDIPEEIYKASRIVDVQYEDVVQIPLEVIANGTPINNVLGEIITGFEAHKWDKDEGSKAIYNSAINDAIAYIEEYVNEMQATELLAEARKCAESEEE